MHSLDLVLVALGMVDFSLSVPSPDWVLEAHGMVDFSLSVPSPDWVLEAHGMVDFSLSVPSPDWVLEALVAFLVDVLLPESTTTIDASTPLVNVHTK